MFYSQVSWENKERIIRRLQILQKNETFCSGPTNPNFRTKARKGVQSFLPGVMQKLSPQKPGPTPAVTHAGELFPTKTVRWQGRGRETLATFPKREGAQTRGHHFIGKVNRSPSKTLGTLSLERVPGTEAMFIPFQFTTSGELPAGTLLHAAIHSCNQRSQKARF